MQLSVVIINFNTYQLTIDCIKSVQQSAVRLAYEVIVVDNAPKEDYREGLLQHFPDLVYLLSKENIGFGRANNLGMEHAKGEYILLLNSDTIVKGDCLPKCLEFIQSMQGQNVGMMGCKLLNDDGSHQHSFYPFVKNTVWNYFISNNPIMFRLFKVAEKYNKIDETKQVGDISGAFMLLHRKVVDAVKGFDPDFFLYCEETEWCRDRINNQFKIYYYPHAETIHFGGKSAPREQMFIQSKLSLSLVWYKKGWLSYIGYILLTYLNVFYFWLTYPFTKGESTIANKRYRHCYAEVWPYLFNQVIKYPRGYNSRKEPLVYEGAREIFFGKKS
ncbi:MAG: glycosyltransferase family 2 protein [Sphingobacteriales bacterium]|nr:MAG: glycosyltransferase family 2 protein [Sphingobacteriales bacterium]